MRVWVDETVDRITALNPSNVLEIGCGTGQFLLRLAPRCARYVGTDISPGGLDRLATRLTADTTAELAVRPADDFTGFTEGEFDTIILNSVVQYFDVDYLLRVLRGALALLAPGGHLFVGDVRDLRLVEAFHCWVQAARLPDATPAADLRRLVDQQIAQEEELLLHPALFETIAPAERVTLLAKSSPHRNELTRFRYDVVITAPGGPDTPRHASTPGTPGRPAHPSGPARTGCGARPTPAWPRTWPGCGCCARAARTPWARCAAPSPPRTRSPPANPRT
ncbi:class I SAM-dependent methyltransferase [Streptomyces sp. KL116D]|uniref:class I SAM-dependent methyltransferase n=1 Tax=Streptomyces sp. KL116D TaxID=3045152 RepID=UPI003558446E